MQYLQELLAGFAGILLTAVLVHRFLRQRARRRELDFTRKLETLLQPRETVKVICPQKGGHCILTNSRILFEKKGDFSGFSLKELKKLQGKNKKGNRTSVPENMVCLTIMLEKEYVLQNTGPEFVLLAGMLQERLQNQRKKKNEKK